MKDKKKEIKSKFEVAMRGKGKQTKGIKTKGKSVDKGKEATNVKPKGKKGSEVEPLTETSNTNITICVVCLEDTDEDWIQCSSCRGWIHEACADIPECGDDYICDRCRQMSIFEWRAIAFLLIEMPKHLDDTQRLCFSKKHKPIHNQEKWEIDTVSQLTASMEDAFS
ncbi:unnamed protein product [Danaus chrysippus]|uniref:(African queen) hypothetical protein n=1 Tax=Danaus chrysippus TaxID=151541 RepID=A0A8J2QPJ1_9NEOP|nr:unnamed protein product [Danaus chrysippus]